MRRRYSVLRELNAHSFYTCILRTFTKEEFTLLVSHIIIMKYPRESIYKEKRDILIHNSGRPSPPLLLVSGKHKAHVSGANH